MCYIIITTYYYISNSLTQEKKKKEKKSEVQDAMESKYSEMYLQPNKPCNTFKHNFSFPFPWMEFFC